MAYTANTSNATMAENRSPLFHATSNSYFLRSPMQLSGNADGSTLSGAATREEEHEEGDTVNDNLFSGQTSPSYTNQTTPDWVQTTPSHSPLATSKVSTKSPYRPPIGSSSPSAPTTSRASARPLFQERSNNSPFVKESSSSSSSGRSGAKRQLMPSIPARKESATSVEQIDPRSKSSTNIQTLAQAIAARAQHVAAANALAKASNPDIASLVVAQAGSTGTSTAAAAAEVDRDSPSVSMRRSISPSSSQLESELIGTAAKQEEATRSEGGLLKQAPVNVIDLDKHLSRDSTLSQESSRSSKAGWNMAREPDLVDVQEGRRQAELDSNDTSHGKFRTSDSDHSTSTGQTSQLDHRTSTLGGALLNGQRRGSAKSLGSSGSHDLQSDGGHTMARSPISGLGIVEGAQTSPSNAGKNGPSSDSYGTAPDAASSTPNAPLQSYKTPELPFPSSSSIGTDSNASPNPTRTRRKSRPNALTLNLLASPKTPASTSLSRAAVSPSKTPPPTMPPSEPLPPVPPTPSSAYQRASSISNRLSSPRNSGLDSSSPLIAAFAAMASNRSRPRQESDPSPKKAQFDDSSTLLQRRSTHSTSVMVSANHATTLAGAENAQAVLNQVAVEPSYNEKRASLRLLAKETSPSEATLPMPKQRTSVVESKEVKGANASGANAPAHARIKEEQEELASSRVTSSANDDESMLPYDRTASEGDEEGSGADEGEVGEAVVTRITSNHGTANVLSLSRGKNRLVRTESTPAPKDPLAIEAVDSTAARIVAGEAQAGAMGSRQGDKEAATMASYEAAKPPSAWNSRQVEKASSTSTASAAYQGGMSTPAVETPSEMHSTAPVLWRSDVDEGRSSLSPADGFGRKRGTFKEISSAFKQLQAEKRVLERVIRATTPLAGVGNGEDLSQYITSLSSKLALSTAEIRRLLDLLDQQRNIMDYMVETHQLESEAYLEEITDLKDDLEAAELEAETHRSNCIKLTENVDRAQQDVVDARAESQQVKRTLADEVAKRDTFTQLLRKAREELAKMDAERAQAVQAKGEGENAHSAARSALENAQAEHAAEMQSQREAHAEELQALRVQMAARTPLGKRKSSSDNSSTYNAAVVVDLQRQLNESRNSQAESERQLQELKLASAAKSNDEVSEGSISPFIAASSETEEALRDKLAQQEQDIAELRAAVALGSGAGGTNGEQLASLPAGRADQVQQLLADLADKRTREAQIRSAYKQLRDEMRKLQLSQLQDRKRQQASYSYLHNSGAAGSSSASGHGHGMAPSSSYLGTTSIDSDNPGSPDSATKEAFGLGPTPRALKRLSLPLGSKQLSGFPLSSTVSSGGSRATTSPSALARLSVDGQAVYSSRKYRNADDAAESTSQQEEEHTETMATSPDGQVEKLLSSSP